MKEILFSKITLKLKLKLIKINLLDIHKIINSVNRVLVSRVIIQPQPEFTQQLFLNNDETVHLLKTYFSFKQKLSFLIDFSVILKSCYRRDYFDIIGST